MHELLVGNSSNDANNELHVEASLRFQKWFEQQTAAGRYVTYVQALDSSSFFSFW